MFTGRDDVFTQIHSFMNLRIATVVSLSVCVCVCVRACVRRLQPRAQLATLPIRSVPSRISSHFEVTYSKGPASVCNGLNSVINCAVGLSSTTGYTFSIRQWLVGRPFVYVIAVYAHFQI
jgi:hypothetical protein